MKLHGSSMLLSSSAPSPRISPRESPVIRSELNFFSPGNFIISFYSPFPFSCQGTTVEVASLNSRAQRLPTKVVRCVLRERGGRERLAIWHILNSCVMMTVINCILFILSSLSPCRQKLSLLMHSTLTLSHTRHFVS